VVIGAIAIRLRRIMPGANAKGSNRLLRSIYPMPSVKGAAPIGAP